MSSGNVQLSINQRRKSIKNRDLLIAASEGQLSEVQLSIRAGADVNFIDSDGNTALHYAVASDRLNVVQHLLRVPAVDITHENNAHLTSLDLARERNVTPIVNLIEEQIWRNAVQAMSEENLQNSKDSTGRSTAVSQSYIEATFSGNFTVPLTVDDVRNILKFRYLKDNENVMFGVTNCKEEFLHMLYQVKKSPKKCVILAALHHSRWTVIAIDFKSDKQCYYALIEKPGFRYHDLCFQSVLSEVLNADIKFFEFPYETYKSIGQDSGVYALKCVDIFLANSENQKIRPNENIWNSFDIEDEKIFLANLLNEKQRTEQKIKACSKMFQSLIASEKNIEQLTFQNVNAFVLFLETFALEDTYIAQGNSKLKEIRKIKKDYFSHFYFQPKNEKVEGKPDYRLIIDARSSLLHCSRIVTLDDCRMFVRKGKQVEDFFREMNSFILCILAKISSADQNQNQNDIKCSSFLATKNEFNEVGKEGDLEQFGKFMKDLYRSENEFTDAKLQQVMFDLTVNVIPLLDNIKEKIGPLGDVRNVLIHNFQKYDSQLERLKEMKRLTFSLKSNMFKYFYAKKVHDVLKKYCLYGTYESLDSKIAGALKDFEDDFKQIAQVTSMEDANSFEYLFEGSIFPIKHEAIDKLVQQYFEFMIYIDHATDLVSSLCDDDRDKSDNSDVRHEISDLQRREIFEDMAKIKSVLSTNVDFKTNKLMELKSNLKHVGISETCVENIIKKAFANEGFDEQTKLQMGLIRDNILVIKKLCIKDYIPLQTLISSYKGKNFAPIVELLCDSRQREKTYVEGKFKSLLRGKFKISFGGDEIQISYVTITINILQLFYSAFNKYQIKFNNAGEAFKDEIFLDYLISRFHEEDEKDELQAYVMLKKLSKIKYTTPFVVHLLEKYPKIWMELVETRNLFEICCKDDFLRPFLTKFIKVAFNGMQGHIFEEIVTILLSKDEIDHNVLDVIMQDPKHLKPFLEETLMRLKKKPSTRVIHLTQMVLEEIITKIKQLIYKNAHTPAEELIDQEHVLAIFQTFVRHNNETVNEFYLYAAKIKNFIGSEAVKKKHLETAEQLFKSALTFLGKVTNANTRHSFLVLSRVSYTTQLMGQYDGAIKGYERLFKEITEYALSLPDLDSKNMFEDSFYDLVQQSDLYLELLHSAEENRKYLDILEVRFSMAYVLTLQGKYHEAIQIYKDLYKYQKSCGKYKGTISRTLTYIARYSKLLGDVYREENEIPEAIKCYIDSLVASTKSLKIKTEIHGGIHPVIRYINSFNSGVIDRIKRCKEARFS